MINDIDYFITKLTKKSEWSILWQHIIYLNYIFFRYFAFQAQYDLQVVNLWTYPKFFD